MSEAAFEALTQKAIANAKNTLGTVNGARESEYGKILNVSGPGKLMTLKL
jgi:hypothetical protein